MTFPMHSGALGPPTPHQGERHQSVQARTEAVTELLVPGGGMVRQALQRSELWSDIAGHALESLFSSPLWVEALARTYGFEINASTIRVNGKAEAALLFCEVADIRGRRIVSVPFADFCDPLVLDAESWHRLIAPLVSMRLPIFLRSLRAELPATDDGFAIVSRATWHGIDLTMPEVAIWESFSLNARKAIKKARRYGVTVREGRSLDDVRTFYQMHCHVRKQKYRLLPQPFAFFVNLHELFASQARMTILIAELDGKPIAACLFLEWGGILYDKFSASVELGPAPNDLLIWEGVKMGQRHGLSLFDFGASDLTQPSLVAFKRKFATEEKTILRLRWEPEGYADYPAQQADRLLRNMTDLLTDPRVPSEITSAAGDQFYGLFC